MPADSRIDPAGEKLRKGEMSGRMRRVLLISSVLAVATLLGTYLYFAATN